MKTIRISKILSTTILVAVEVRCVETVNLTHRLNRLLSGVTEMENLVFQANTLRFEGKSSEAEAVKAVAQSKLEALAIDYKMAITESKFSAFGWALRKPLITKNPMYESIREYLKKQ